MIKFENLMFKNDFLFSAVCNENPEIVRKMTEVITGRKITKIHNLRQQDWVTADPILKKVRLDVTFEGDDAIYCVEMQVSTEKEIEKRIRYYQSAKDIEQINDGGRYEELQPLYIIFICDYDPFGDGLQKYSFHNRCEETGEYLEDGRDIIVLNTRGEETEDESLNTLLDYIRTGEVKENDLTQEIEEASERVRYNKDWREGFMTIGEKMERLAREAREQERIHGIFKAIQLLQKLNLDDERICKMITEQYEISPEEYQEILKLSQDSDQR